MLLMASLFFILEVSLLIGLIMAYQKLCKLNTQLRAEMPLLLAQLRDTREQIKGLNLKLEAAQDNLKGLLKSFGWQGQIAWVAFKQTQAKMSQLRSLKT